MSALWSAEQRGVILRTKKRLPTSIDSGHCGTLQKNNEEDDGYLRASCTESCSGYRCNNGIQSFNHTSLSTAENIRTVTSDVGMEENVFVFEPEETKPIGGNIEIKSEINLNVSMYDNIKVAPTTKKTSLANEAYGFVIPCTTSVQQVRDNKTIVQVHMEEKAEAENAQQNQLEKNPTRNGSISSDTSSGFQSDYNETPRTCPKHTYINEIPIDV